ncbi:MAG: tripartite tricarboxylate transporter substrate binding protein [Pseudomonadota bacterium]|nr:tripartite tricarboxylate transporter substrate binding protein [Pseudomonadota bacterium]
MKVNQMHNRLWLAAAISLMVSLSAQAQQYPSRPVTIINPYAAGSSTDVMARALAVEFQEALGQSFVVVSRDGASGVVGMTVVRVAAPDGLTLAYTPATALTVQPHLVAGTHLGPDALQPICGVAENILAIAVRADSPLTSVGDIVKKSKEAGSLSYGSPGPNSGPSLGVEDLARQQKINFVHLPFRGDAASIQELLAGRMDFDAVVAASAAPFTKAGSVRLLAVMSKTRHPDFPEVPTLEQLGYPVTQLSYTGIYGPKGMPPEVVNTLEQTCAKAVAGNAIKRVATNSKQVLTYQSRAQMEQMLTEQFRLQGERLRAVGAVK